MFCVCNHELRNGLNCHTLVFFWRPRRHRAPGVTRNSHPVWGAAPLESRWAQLYAAPTLPWARSTGPMHSPTVHLHSSIRSPDRLDSYNEALGPDPPCTGSKINGLWRSYKTFWLRLEWEICYDQDSMYSIISAPMSY